MTHYRIEFLTSDGSPMSSCHFQIMLYSRVLHEGVADGKGRASFNADLVKNKQIWLRFWGKGQTQETAFASQNFTWQANVVTQPVRAPETYEIILRETENKSNEPAEYRQAFYEVQAGDTWESIAQKCETEAVLLRLINHLPEDDPPEAGDALLLPRGAKRPLKQSPTDGGVIPSVEDDAVHQVLVEYEEKRETDSGVLSEKLPEKASLPSINQQEQPDNSFESAEIKPAESEAPAQKPMEEKPKLERSKPKLENQRSAENGKPETKVYATIHKHTENCSANFHKISSIILLHEGGIVDDPADSGGLTNMGIAWKTWVTYAKTDLGVEPTRNNLRILTKSQAEIIYRKRYWEPRGFCQLKNLKVALMIYDWSITSGGAIVVIKKLINFNYNTSLKIDSKMKEDTIEIINSIDDQEKLLNLIAERRKKYYTDLTIRNPKNKKFLRGWINRVNDCLKFEG